MKNIIKIILTVFIITGLWSCKKDENRVILEGGTPPVLSSTISENVPLSFANQSKKALTLNWTNPDYKFNTGANSLDVNYNILIDSKKDFNSSNVKTISVGTDLSRTFTQAAFNDILLNQLQMDTLAAAPVYIRVDAFFVGGAQLLSSNSLILNAKPYAIPPKIVPPESGDLYIVGDATPGGWPPFSNNPSIQKFTKVSPTLFQITIAINGSKEYKFVEVPGQWDKQWSVQTEPDAGSAGTLSGDLYFNGGNGRAPQESGTYQIVVDFQRGKYTFTKQ